MSYPLVLDEASTLRMVLDGHSIARFGDGEFNLCDGIPAKRQAPDPRLQSRLTSILRADGPCLIGIPNIRSRTPKARFWRKYLGVPHLVPRFYVSSFVTRPDSAPWIDTLPYWAQVEALWKGQDVTLVRGSAKSLTADDLRSAASVREVIAPECDAWTHYDALLEQIGTPARAILCLGPTATVMAVDLCVKGVHAIDMGHVGMFLRKHRRGEPMIVTAADKAA
jgi:hypothetical protein